MVDIETERILRRNNRRWERDNAPGAASRRAMREDRQTRRGRSSQSSGKPNIAAFRRAELIRIYESRWRAVLPDDDSGRDDVQLYADHCDNFDVLKAFCAKHAPWMSAEEIDGVFILRRKQFALHLTDAERTRLGIRTIGAIDYTKAARTKRRKRMRREQEAARRHAAGAKPRSQSLMATRPWDHETPPISRSKWYGRRKAKREAAAFKAAA